MAESVFEKTDAQVAESIGKFSRATSAMADAIGEGVGVIKRIVKRSGDAGRSVPEFCSPAFGSHPRVESKNVRC